MKVEKLLLKNFGPFHGAHRIDFGVLGDIFLVCGKTGAGKTTIFDAIAYALYGNIPGGRKGLVKQMRCQFAESADESAVELEFSLGRDRYRVRRSLPGETTGKRSGKITETPEQVTLEKKSGAAWESGSAAKKSETDEMILALIGLSLEEFSRIILLPQGEFAQFLRLNSKDRKDVLLKLFPMEQYTRLIEEARERSRNAGLRLKDKETALAALRNEYDNASYAGERTTLLASITAREAEHAALLDSYQKQSRICEQARAADQ
ncbi:MAG: AAA family ATPase, partial [Treponema sp.]|nr:AAA family ATPase [Treponema sp.]